MARLGKHTRIYNRFQYHAEDMDCAYCLYFEEKRRVCPLGECCCEEEKREALMHGRIKRPPRAMLWYR